MRRIAIRCLAWAAIMGGLPAPAFAQSANNEVWIGQTGSSNTISITQEGVANKVGADADAFRLGQEGVNNEVDINQYGWNNEVGASAGGLAGDPVGFRQVGRGNGATVVQENGEAAGSNSVGTLYQESPATAADDSNEIMIVQRGSGPLAGAAGHVIGAVLQIHDLVTAASNLISLSQSGGGVLAGNVIDRVLQSGSGNFLDMIQNDQDQFIGYVEQSGSGHVLAAEQSGGNDNAIENITQSGAFNQANVVQSGFRNVILSLFQVNDGVAISGNTIEVTIAGDDNGGDGFGGTGYFGPLAAAVGVEQGVFLQVGDDNDARLTISRGDQNLFGMSQFGDGNGSIAVIDGDANEVASLQIGDDNNFTDSIHGNSNVAAAMMDGERNRFAVLQTGTFNTASLSVQGSDNNILGSESLFGGLSIPAGLSSGLISQDGIANEITVAITGDNNFSSVLQIGDDNISGIEILGSGNAVAISQQGVMNVAFASQNGIGNRAVIIQ